MGSSSSKFRKHLQNGDEVQALQLYTNSTDLQKALDPNCSYGDSHQHETPLHFASRHGMKTLLRIFLYDKGGNPNKTNAKKETALHCVCMERNSQYYNVQKRRVECLNMVLNWRGATLQEGQVERIELGALDEKKNTALHYAAASGLRECVEILVHHGAPLSVENEDNWTPCESAEKSGHDKIARYLESKIVFSTDVETESLPPIEEYCGLRAQDLQEAKDQLLVETADMLSVPLFTAEALLRNHEWSRETLLEAWMENPVLCCQKCGVTPPASLFSETPQVQESLASPLPSPSHATSHSQEVECNICTLVFMLADEPVHMTCTHQFCRECWERYLTMKIQEGDAHHIICPAFDCSMLVPVEVIENVVSRDMARRYLQFDIKAFVDSNPDMKWCPYPGCGRAVKLPEVDGMTASSSQSRSTIPSDTSRSVDCGAGHYFCWECQGEAHEPCSCENWVKWQQKIADVRPEELNGTDEETEMAANCLWLVTNSKPCPNCKSPIQKNEGCNHMKCSKCKHDFCWVCLEQWKRHNSSTGGYFKCNRYEAVKKVEEQTQQVVTDAEEKNTRMQELNRFVHYYTRFKNHENSYKFEEPLLQTAKDKMMKLAEAVTDIATANAETQFVEDAVRQLLKARRVLKCSYIYGYYLDGLGYKKIVFEFMQTELEECTEILSQMVNRLYLRTPRARIIEQAHNVQRRRLEFTAAIAKGLVPPETPPSLKKGRRRRKYSMEMEDEDLRKAIMASIQEVDPGNPWIKDASGRHTNVMALLEWPMEDSDDSDSEVSVAALREYGKCRRVGCSRPKAVNPRTQEIHDYCSRRCKHHDEVQHLTETEDQSEDIPEVILDEHMDLLRALEMSRLQYLRDRGLLSEPEAQKSGSSSGSDKSQKASVSGRPRSNSSGTELKSRKKVGGLTPMEELDIELQRVLELSSTIPQSSLGESSSSKADQGGGRKKKFLRSRFAESTSSVVTRVPNKSVEDLFCLDCGPKVKGTMGASHSSSVSSHSELSPGAERPSTSSDYGPLSSESTSPDGAHGLWGEEEADGEEGGEFGESSMFGTIKDLSVSNIHASDADKTSEFLSKDLHALFSFTKNQPASSSATVSQPGFSSALSEGEYSLHSGEEGGAFLLATPPVRQRASSADNVASTSYGRSDREAFGGRPGTSSSASLQPPSPTDGPELLTARVVVSAPDSQSDIAGLQTYTAASRGRVSRKGSKESWGEVGSGKSFKSGTNAERIGSTTLTPIPTSADGEAHDAEHVSLLEMAESLLQMTAEMHSHVQRLHLNTSAVDGDNRKGERSGGVTSTASAPAALSTAFSHGQPDNLGTALPPPLPLPDDENMNVDITEKSDPALGETVAETQREAAEDDTAVDVVEQSATGGGSEGEDDASVAKERPSFFV